MARLLAPKPLLRPYTYCWISYLIVVEAAVQQLILETGEAAVGPLLRRVEAMGAAGDEEAAACGAPTNEIGRREW